MRKLNFNVSANSALQLIADLKKDSRLHNYEITIDNVLLFANYLEQTNNCMNCKSIDKCQNNNKGYYPIVIKEGYYSLEYHECKKFKKMQELLRQKENAKFIYLPASYGDASFKNYKINSANAQKAYDYAYKFVKEFDRKKPMEGLFLTGKFRTGKTYLLACLANELAKKDVKSILVYFPDLSRSMKSSISANTLEKDIEQLKTIDVLMLDDFGAEMMTPWLRDEVLSPIINYRYQEKLPVFITSNFDFDGIRDNLANEKDDLKAQRIIERLKVMSIRCILTKTLDE